MQLSDLPLYTGTPTAEMQAANIGLADGMYGLLDWWKIYTSYNNDSVPASSPAPGGGPITVVPPPSPSPSPAPSSNPGFLVPHGSSSSSAQVQAAVLGTAAAAEASIQGGFAAAGPAGPAAAAAAVGMEASGTNPKRKLLQTAAAAGGVCNKGTPTSSSTLNTPLGSSRFGAGKIGFSGLSTADTWVLPPDLTIAVGPDTALHVVNSLVAIYKVNPGTGNPASLNSTKPALLVSLPFFFTLVAPQCSGGYFSPSATYDKLVGRFLLTAVCGGDANQILLAVSSSSSALGG
uniref:Uncharacterized protein n=1 Tax=Tetradesmus obliquus TaxID=3088 RepID=A0A383VQL3_TETOB|eukprot:jgi/Sobl393_1/16423/SZX67805.1